MNISTYTGEHEYLPFPLLLQADPSMKSISEYIHRSTNIVATIDTKTVGICCLLHTRPFTYEIVNVSVHEDHQQQGIGKKLIEHAIQLAKQAGAHNLEIYTGNSSIHQLILYQRVGFELTGVEKDYFINHYAEKIVENGIQCKHLLRLVLHLK
ncbi:GNAT family N-acetyltransferase [Priestia taiwanensis]|uniref:N-acetyltransferase n=1 Tax=Priestia taiwanensis TaxID=1347902 RepID=A0A917ANZ5_9BACI|nr:GNAT family N-acetyltransferase [Priestia taiwanensis]MBM7362535.1 ribosomal protein S18 acetylase RimI-like enzyme [Priestia taiwanensis]GGE63003.1 N-acetyltransferase [Priestia taiwanensis]